MNYLLRAAVLPLCLLAGAAQANVGKVSGPDVTHGTFEVDYSGTHTDPRRQGHELEFEYGVNDDWALALALHGGRDLAGSTDLSAIGLEAQYQMTEQGPWWFASAVKGEYQFAYQSGDPDETDLKFYLRHTTPHWRHTANIGFERQVGGQRRHGITADLRWQSVYRYRDFLKPGMEWHAALGALNDPQHDGAQYLGPVVTGTLLELAQGEIGYTLGYYRGITGAAASDAARLQLGYELQF